MKHVHFIGIGGVGMSGLARILLEKKTAYVSGSDLRATPLTNYLSSLGATIFEGHKGDHLPDNATVILSSDISESNPELQAAREKGFTLLHRSDLLAELMREHLPLLVAGSHGKTTTSSLLSHVLCEAGVDPSFAIGGTPVNLGTNARYGKSHYFVAEADESDGTFLKYQYHSAIVTNVDSEHLSHFGSRKALEEAFSKFIDQGSAGRLFFCGDDPTLQQWQIDGISYGFQEGNDLQILKCSYMNGASFDISYQGRVFQRIQIPLFGEHNVLNAAAVFGLALSLDISEEVIRKAFASFAGVRRRAEHKDAGGGCYVIDDYAHHPTEVRATLQSIRQQVGERRILTIFQPHRPSRLRYCLPDFAGVFQEADMLFVTDLYLASESPSSDISTEMICSLIKETHKLPCRYIPRDQISEHLIKIARPFDCILFLGAGDITYEATSFAKAVKNQGLQKWRVGILYGGMNSENKISRVSARAIWDALDRPYYHCVGFEINQHGNWRTTDGVCLEESEEVEETISDEVWSSLQSCDLYIPVLHGPFGEDGTVQGFLEVLQKPYVGCSHAACSVAMDKVWTKKVLEASGIPVLPYVAIAEREWREHSSHLLEQIQMRLQSPFFVKAAHFGSSVGVEKIDDFSLLSEAIERGLQYDTTLIVEQGIEARELEFAVCGNTHVMVPNPGEILVEGKIYDYHAKYGEKSVATTVNPYGCFDRLEEWKALVKKIYIALGCTGLARIDCFVDTEGKFYCNEVNPFPGFTSISLYPAVWERQGVSTSELLNQLVVMSLFRFRESRKKAARACALGRQLEGMCTV